MVSQWSQLGCKNISVPLQGISFQKLIAFIEEKPCTRQSTYNELTSSSSPPRNVNRSFGAVVLASFLSKLGTIAKMKHVMWIHARRNMKLVYAQIDSYDIVSITQ